MAIFWLFLFHTQTHTLSLSCLLINPLFFTKRRGNSRRCKAEVGGGSGTMLMAEKKCQTNFWFSKILENSSWREFFKTLNKKFWKHKVKILTKYTLGIFWEIDRGEKKKKKIIKRKRKKNLKLKYYWFSFYYVGKLHFWSHQFHFGPWQAS